MLPDNVLSYGIERPLPEQRLLRAGPLSLVYEEGDLRYIRLGDREILRRVYAAVRDRNWGTVPAILSNVEMEIEADSLRITYDVEHEQDDIDFRWRGSITGDAQGTIRFNMDGEAHSTFLRNRIGFCVLHPVRECAGQPCLVEKPDGAVEQGTFPRYISPHQPFKEMRAISHEVVPGVRAEVRFEGEVFEMEDQRNWTDASYKTYCTPLALPYPVEVRRGDRISQSVILSLKGDLAVLRSVPRQAEVSFAIGEPAGPLPCIGLGVASHGQPLSARELERLRALGLSHLRVDLHLHLADHPQTLRRSTEEAQALGVALEVALFLTDAAGEELRALVSLLKEVRPPVLHWLVFHEGEKSTSERWVRLAREHLSGYDPTAQIGAGTNAYFTELNRCRPPVDTLDLVCFSINPQVHAFDNASLVETLEAQAATVESARQFTSALPLAVTPVTLRPRFNPNATGPEREPAPGELPASVDIRQMSLFGAGWTAISLKYLAESGVSSLTCFETTGWRGVMETEAGSPCPEQFHSIPGGVFPLYHVLADVGDFSGGEVIQSRSGDPLRIDGLVLQKNGRRRMLLANFTAQTQRLAVHGWSGPALTRALDGSAAEEAMRDPKAYRTGAGIPIDSKGGRLYIELPPFAIVTVDSQAER